jgi:hypothetical protein
MSTKVISISSTAFSTGDWYPNSGTTWINPNSGTTWINPLPNVSGGTWIPTITSPALPICYYLITCPHCQKTFLSFRPHVGSCWDAACPSCDQSICLCLEKCTYDCPNAVDCLLVGMVDDIESKCPKIEIGKVPQKRTTKCEFPAFVATTGIASTISNAVTIDNVGYVEGGTATFPYTLKIV